jgi:hypothetical protein
MVFLTEKNYVSTTLRDYQTPTGKSTSIFTADGRSAVERRQAPGSQPLFPSNIAAKHVIIETENHRREHP